MSRAAAGPVRNVPSVAEPQLAGRRSVLRRGLGHGELADDAQLAAEVPAVPEVVAHGQGRPEELGEGGAHGLHRPAGGSRRHEGELAAVVGGDGLADDGVARLLQGRPAQHGQPPPLLGGQGLALRPAHLPQAGAVEGDRGRGVGDERVQLPELVAGHGLGRPPLRLVQLVEHAQDHRAPHGGHDGPVDPGHRRLDREHGGGRRHVTSVGGRGQPREVTSAGGVRNSSLTNRATLFTLPRDPPNRPDRISGGFFFGGTSHHASKQTPLPENRGGRVHYEVAAVISVLGLAVVGRPLLAGGQTPDAALTLPASAALVAAAAAPRPPGPAPAPPRLRSSPPPHPPRRRPHGLVRPRGSQPGHREPGRRPWPPSPSRATSPSTSATGGAARGARRPPTISPARPARGPPTWPCGASSGRRPRPRRRPGGWRPPSAIRTGPAAISR